MSGELDPRKDSQSTKFERSPRLFVKLSFRELCYPKLFRLYKVISFQGTPILELTFLTLTENSSVVINDTQGPHKYPHCWK